MILFCRKCKEELPESQLELSHDIPCYLFEGKTRGIRKNQADQYGRHRLCKKCHKKYELKILKKLISQILRQDENEVVEDPSLISAYMNYINKLSGESREKCIQIALKIKEDFYGTD